MPGRSAFEAEHIARREFAVAQVIEGASVKVVRTGFRDDVDDASTATAEFGRKVGMHDAEFLDSLLAHDESEVGPFTSALTTEEGLIEIGAVDVDRAVDPSGSGQAQLPAFHFLVHTRCQEGKVQEPAAVERKRGSLRVVDEGPGLKLKELRDGCIV